MSKVYEQFIRLLTSSTSNIAQSFYDDYVEKNTTLRARAGVKCFVIRRQVGRCCEWCASLAGIYEKGEEPADVYKRHRNCKCMVTFKTERGTYSDVWSKREFETQRAARIAREKEIIKESNKNNYKRSRRIELLEQSNSSGEIAADLLNDFSRMDKLTLSEQEKEILIELNKKSVKTKIEYGQAKYEGGESDVFTSELKNKVSIPKDILEKKHLKLYHSHTNETMLSTVDLSKLCLTNVEEITNVSINGNAYTIEVGDGYRPSKKEFAFDTYNINNEVDKEFFPLLLDGSLTLQEYNYKAIQESLIRISHKYGWTVKGGKLIE